MKTSARAGTGVEIVVYVTVLLSKGRIRYGLKGGIQDLLLRMLDKRGPLKGKYKNQRYGSSCGGSAG